MSTTLRNEVGAFVVLDSGWEVAVEMDERRLLIAATVLVAAMLLAWWLTFGMS